MLEKILTDFISQPQIMAQTTKRKKVSFMPMKVILNLVVVVAVVNTFSFRLVFNYCCLPASQSGCSCCVWNKIADKNIFVT